MNARRAGRLLAVASGPAVVVSLVTFAARVTGFGRTLVFSAAVGNTDVGNAYNRANLVPNVLFEIVAGGVLAAVVVPLLAGGMASGDARGRAEADRIASALLTWVLTVLVPLAAVVLLLAHPIAGLLIPGQDAADGAVDLGADLLRLFAVQLPLYGTGAVLGGVLHAHRRFFWPAVAPLLSSLVVVGAYVGFAALVGAGSPVLNDPLALSSGGRWLLGAGTTAGVAALTLPLLWPVRAAGVRLRPTWSFPPGTVRTAVALAAAGVSGVLAQQVAVLTVARATRGIDGGRVLTLVGYAQAVTLMPYAVLVVPLVTTTFPGLAAAAARGDGGRLRGAVAASVSLVAVAGMLGTAGQVAVADPMQRFFSGLDAGGVPGLSRGLVAYAPGVVAFGLTMHLSRVLSATRHASAVALGVGVGWVTVTLTSVAVLAPWAEDVGPLTVLGAANSVGMIASAGVLLWAVRRRLGPQALGGLPVVAAAAAVAGLLAATAGGAIGVLLLRPRSTASRSLATCVDGFVAGLGAATVTAMVFLVTLGLLLRRRRLAPLLAVLRRPGGPDDSPGGAPA